MAPKAKSTYRRGMNNAYARKQVQKAYARKFYKNVRRIAYSIPEKKYHQVSRYNVAQAITNAPGFPTVDDATKMTVWTVTDPLNAIEVGTASDNRIGNKIYVRYVQVSVEMTMDGDHLLNASTARMCAFWNRMANNVNTAAADLWTPSTSSIVNQGSLRNVESFSQYTMLLDRQHKTVMTVGHATDPTLRATTGCGVIQFYIPIFKVVEYNNTIIDCSSSNMKGPTLLLCFFNSVSDCCIIKVGWRVCFTDA